MTLDLSSEQLAHLAKNGAGFEIDGSRFSAEQLAHIALSLTGGVMIVANAASFSAQQLAFIAVNGKGKVIFK